ncbi:WD40-repeat-containing domain protein [Gorgonomyces haynaldii]|nr:WD40-repeat-containing domain protein [Gorgonomyces haynaldii]
MSQHPRPLPQHPMHHQQIASLQNQRDPHSPKQHPHQQHMHPSRLQELFEALKHEVEMMSKEASMQKVYRDELEKKLGHQINEMAAFQQALYDLERIHNQMKQKYEEEIHHLRSMLDQQNPERRKGFPEGAPPTLATRPQQGNGSFGNLMPHQMYDKRRDSDPHLRQPQVSKPPPMPQVQQMQQLPPQIQQPPPQMQPMHQPPMQQLPPQMPPKPKPVEPERGRASPSHPPAPTQKKPEEWVLATNPDAYQIQSSGLNVELLHSIEHSSVVCCVKFSPDGKYIATGCNHYAQVFEIASGRRVALLEDTNREGKDPKEDLYIRSVCFSPDGVFLATGAEDHVIRVWDIAHKEIKVRLHGHEADIYSLDWSRDGKLVVSGSGDKTVKVWETESGRLLNSLSNDRDESLLQHQRQNSKDSGVTSVAIRPSGVCVAAGSLDEMIRVWDLRTGHLLERFQGHKNSVYSVAFSPDGMSIVSGSLDRSLIIWNLSPQTLAILSAPADPSVVPPVQITTKYRYRFEGHSDFVLSVGYPGLDGSLGRVDRDGRPLQDAIPELEWIISGSKDRHVIFWDARSSDPEPKPLMTLQGHKNSVISIGLGPNGGLFATGSGDQKARVWRVSLDQQPHPPQLLPASLVKQE